MKTRKVVVLVAVGVVLALIGVCVAIQLRTTYFWTSANIPDVTRPATLRLSHHGWNRPSAVVVRLTGHIDGEAEVWGEHIEGPEGWEPVKLSGDVNWEVYHDWFASDLDFHYRPIQVRSGHLTVQYMFPH
jgi:hypothetical protein